MNGVLYDLALINYSRHLSRFVVSVEAVRTTELNVEKLFG